MTPENSEDDAEMLRELLRAAIDDYNEALKRARAAEATIVELRAEVERLRTAGHASIVPVPGTTAYALAVDADMTDPKPKPGETAREAKARREYYMGVDDNGLPCD